MALKSANPLPPSQAISAKKTRLQPQDLFPIQKVSLQSGSNILKIQNLRIKYKMQREHHLNKMKSNFFFEEKKNFDPRDTGTQKFVGSDRRLRRIKERTGSEDGSPQVRRKGSRGEEDENK
jgi:hypothetical protein